MGSSIMEKFKDMVLFYLTMDKKLEDFLMSKKLSERLLSKIMKKIVWNTLK